MNDNYKHAKSTLEDNIDLLHKLAEMLLDQEVIDGKELDELVNSHKQDKDVSSSPWQNPTPEGSVAFRSSNNSDDA